MGRRSATARERILTAAQRIVLRDGVARLTLDAVAQEARVSKGGVLYHFRAKDALILGMISRLIALFEEALAAHAARDPEEEGRWTRAYVAASLLDPKVTDKSVSRLSTAILGAVANNPRLLDPLRERFRAWQQILQKDRIDPAIATIVRLVTDALWMADLFQLPPLSPKIHKRVLAELDRLARARRK